MPPKRRSATASNTSSSASTPVPLRSTRSSAKSTPATSVPTSSGEEPKKTQSAAGRKRHREEELDSDALDGSDVAPEPATKPRGRKKRAVTSKVAVKLSALQEKPAPKAKPAPKVSSWGFTCALYMNTEWVVWVCRPLVRHVQLALQPSRRAGLAFQR